MGHNHNLSAGNVVTTNTKKEREYKHFKRTSITHSSKSIDKISQNCVFFLIYIFYLPGTVMRKYEYVVTETPSNPLPKYQYVIKNRSGKYRLFVDGIPYNKHDSQKDRIYWRCSYSYKMER